MDEVTDGPVLLRREGAAAVVTLNRPDQRNAFNPAALDALRDAIAAAAGDAAVSAVIITGAGDRAFCAGADIRHMQQMAEDDARHWTRHGHEVFQAVEECSKPVIAAINGVAAGGGCELALACDFRLMVEDASIGQPEIKLGIIPGWGGTQRLPRLVGVAAAKDLILTGRLVSAHEALAMRLVHEVLPAARLMSRALELANQFAALPPLALAMAKRAIDLGRDVDLREGSAMEMDLFSQCFATEDKSEGFAAFVEKRAPQFKGR